MKNGSHEQGFALVIAHYNYLLRCVVSGLRAVSPLQPDQRVTLSLDSPLRETLRTPLHRTIVELIKDLLWH